MELALTVFLWSAAIIFGVVALSFIVVAVKLIFTFFATLFNW